MSCVCVLLLEKGGLSKKCVVIRKLVMLFPAPSLNPPPRAIRSDAEQREKVKLNAYTLLAVAFKRIRIVSLCALLVLRRQYL